MELTGQFLCRQVIPYIKGKGCTGKSTIIDYLAGRFYEKADLGSLSNNCEKQFGISAFCDKFLWLAGEIKSDFRIEQVSQLQAFTSHMIDFLHHAFT